MNKFIYLISPDKISSNFFSDLDKVLSSNNVEYFQLRLKNMKYSAFLKIANRIKKITLKHRVKLIINDNFVIALKINADGCHMGQKDGLIISVRRKLKGKILGVTCHNSKFFAGNAIKSKADYIAFGSFFKSKLKPKAKDAKISILRWAKKKFKKPIVAIGGINDYNYKKLINAGAKYIAISSFIWDNPKLKPEQAIRKFK